MKNAHLEKMSAKPRARLVQIITHIIDALIVIFLMLLLFGFASFLFYEVAL